MNRSLASNSTSVLVPGNIGALAGQPVLQGKGVLFQSLADVDVFDIELNSYNPQEIIKAVLTLDRTFSGIFLEDIQRAKVFHIKARKVLYGRINRHGETYGKNFFARRIL